MPSFKISLIIYQKQLHFSVQERDTFTVPTLMQYLIQACGGKLTSAYLQFLDMDITETLFHLYQYIELKTQENNHNNQDKLAAWGFTEDDFN